MKLKVAIVGLGRVGSELFSFLCQNEDKGVEIAAVSEKEETYGRNRATAVGIPIKNLQDIANMGESLDLIFDLTGDPETRMELRFLLHNLGNHHTTIVSENVVDLVWALTGKGEIPSLHYPRGYLAESRSSSGSA